MSVYKTDPQYKWGALFIIIFCGLWIWSWPESWPFVAVFIGIIVLITYLKRNSP
jgi:hypothetical protein